MSLNFDVFNFEIQNYTFMVKKISDFTYPTITILYQHLTCDTCKRLQLFVILFVQISGKTRIYLKITNLSIVDNGLDGWMD